MKELFEHIKSITECLMMLIYPEGHTPDDIRILGNDLSMTYAALLGAKQRAEKEPGSAVTAEDIMEVMGKHGETCRVIEHRKALPLLKDVETHLRKYGWGYKGQCNCDQCRSERNLITCIEAYEKGK